MPQKKQTIWNVTNVLTMIRMLLIPVYWALYVHGHTYQALITFVVASLTDVADGFIARKTNQITDFGKLMDPLADKLMVLSVMLSLALRRLVPRTALIILLAKEALMVLGGAVLLDKGVVVYSRVIGKAAQALVVIGLLLCFFSEWIMAHLGFPLHTIVIWCAVGLTLCALISYARSALKLYKEAGEKQ